MTGSDREKSFRSSVEILVRIAMAKRLITSPAPIRVPTVDGRIEKTQGPHERHGAGAVWQHEPSPRRVTIEDRHTTDAIAARRILLAVPTAREPRGSLNIRGSKGIARA